MTLKTTKTHVIRKGRAQNLPKILVVDDEDSILSLFTQLLSARYDVATAIDSGEAMRKMKESPFDVVISDVNMPGMSGVELFEECKSKYPRTDFIIMTGLPKFNDAVNVIKDGAFYYLIKPIDMDLLSSLVDRSVRQRRELEDSAKNLKNPNSNYRIVRSLGSGNTGIVLLVSREDRLYAMKILRKEKDPVNERVREKRFLREAEILMKMKHRNIVEIYEYNMDKTTDSPYLVMEFVDGRPISEYIRTGTLLFEQKLEIIKQIATALGYMHNFGVLHRDIKPENILIKDDLTVKITDFGICRTNDSDITFANELVGSPAYMAPECFVPEGIADFRSDIFSLGVLSYELLTGVRPFKGHDIFQVLEEIRELKPMHPLKINPSLPSWTQDLLAKMLDKDPGCRFKRADDIVETIQACLSGRKKGDISTLTTKLLRSMLPSNTWS